MLVALTPIVPVLALIPATAITLWLHLYLSYQHGVTAWRGHSFRYQGGYPRLVVLAGRVLIFSMLTLCVLGPWSLRSVQKYIAENTSYRGTRFEYVGEPPGAFWKSSMFIRLVLLPVDLLAILGVGNVGELLMAEGSGLG